VEGSRGRGHGQAREEAVLTGRAGFRRRRWHAAALRGGATVLFFSDARTGAMAAGTVLNSVEWLEAAGAEVLTGFSEEELAVEAAARGAPPGWELAWRFSRGMGALEWAKRP